MKIYNIFLLLVIIFYLFDKEEARRTTTKKVTTTTTKLLTTTTKYKNSSIPCSSNGKNVNGSCYCYFGYSGSNCSLGSYSKNTKK